MKRKGLALVKPIIILFFLGICAVVASNSSSRQCYITPLHLHNTTVPLVKFYKDYLDGIPLSPLSIEHNYLHPNTTLEKRLIVTILSSRPNLLRESSRTWMPFLPQGTVIRIAVDKHIYAKSPNEWLQLVQDMTLALSGRVVVLDVFRVSSIINKASYWRGAEVFLSAVKLASWELEKNFSHALWYIFADDDTFLNPPAIVEELFTKRLHEAQERASVLVRGADQGKCNPMCGGPGFLFDDKTMHAIAGALSRLDPCGKKDYGDVQLGQIIQRNVFAGGIHDTDKLVGKKGFLAAYAKYGQNVMSVHYAKQKKYIKDLADKLLPAFKTQLPIDKKKLLDFAQAPCLHSSFCSSKSDGPESRLRRLHF